MGPEAVYFSCGMIRLRPVEERDLEAIRLLRNDETTWVHLTDPLSLTAADQKSWFEGLSRKSGRFYFVAHSTNVPFIGLVRMDEHDTQNRSIRVGADVVPELRGKGYGRDIYLTIKKYAFDILNIHRLWLAVLESNAHAIRLYEKQGFVLEGRYRQAVWRDGLYVDYLLMSLLEDEYHEQKARS